MPAFSAKPHPNSIHFQNFFPQGVGGTISIVAPQSNARATWPSDEKAGEGHNLALRSLDDRTARKARSIWRSRRSVELSVRDRLKNAIFGKQPMRVDFVVDADEQYQFSVYRTMWVGTGDVTLDVKSHLDKDGTLVVEQFMTNNSDRPDRLQVLSCVAKGHRPQRAQVYRLGPTPDRKVYRYPNGPDLVGKELLLEAEEVNGERVVKYRFSVADDQRTNARKCRSRATNVEHPNGQRRHRRSRHATVALADDWANPRCQDM